MLDKFPSILPAVELQLFINCFHGFIESTASSSSDIITVASDEFSICLARSTTEPATCFSRMRLSALRKLIFGVHACKKCSFELQKSWSTG